MAGDKAIVIFDMMKRGQSVDLEVPLDISANDLVTALNNAYHLGIDTSDIKKCFLRMEAPIALLRGEKTLAQFGMRNGSVIRYTD